MRTRSTFIIIVAAFAAFIAYGCSPAPKSARKRAAPADAEVIRSEWQPPDAKSGSSTTSKTLAGTHYSTSQHLDEVWAYYAQKLGIKEKESPPVSYGSSISGSGGTVEISILSTKENGAATRAATLVRRTEG